MVTHVKVTQRYKSGSLYQGVFLWYSAIFQGRMTEVTVGNTTDNKYYEK